MVLRPPLAEHRRPAHVDHLDRVLLGHVETGDGLLERVEVHAHEVEGSIRWLAELGEVALEVAAGEDAGVDARMQRLHAPPEQLGELGDLLDARHRQALGLESGRGATARDELEAELVEAAGQLVEAGLVVDGDQRAHSSRTTLVSSRCSASCTRARRLSTVSPASTGTGSLAITAPVSTPSST